MTRKNNNTTKIYFKMSLGSFAGAAALTYAAIHFAVSRLVINVQIFTIWFLRNWMGWDPIDSQALNSLRESSNYATWITDLPSFVSLLVWALEILVFSVLLWLAWQSLRTSVAFFLKAKKK